MDSFMANAIEGNEQMSQTPLGKVAEGVLRSLPKPTRALAARWSELILG